jgi:hypothetical protein
MPIRFFIDLACDCHDRRVGELHSVRMSVSARSRRGGAIAGCLSWRKNDAKTIAMARGRILPWSLTTTRKKNLSSGQSSIANY